MERNKRTANRTGGKENAESKIPKPTKPSAKEDGSKTAVEKKTSQRWKTSSKAAATSSKVRQTQAPNLANNARPTRMSIAKISKDVKNRLEMENLKSDVNTTDNDARVAVLETIMENTTKRVPLKEKCSLTSQKPSEGLSTKPFTSDHKPSAAFGGLQFIAKRKSNRTFKILPKITMETEKNCQEVNTSAPCNEEPKRIESPSKEVEQSDEGNSENTPTDKAQTSKATSLALKKTILKKDKPFGGMIFSPKWKSTPIRPDIFQGSSPKWLEITPISRTVIPEKKVEAVAVDETGQPPSKPEEKYLETSATLKEVGARPKTTFAGMRMIPKRKSLYPDVFKSTQTASKNINQGSHSPGTSSEQMKMSPDDSKAIMKTDTQSRQVEKLKRPTKEKVGETTAITINKANRTAAFGGMHFANKRKSTAMFVRRPMFETTQKESKIDL